VNAALLSNLREPAERLRVRGRHSFPDTSPYNGRGFLGHVGTLVRNKRTGELPYGFLPYPGAERRIALCTIVMT
jgi:hypothetical protein